MRRLGLRQVEAQFTDDAGGGEVQAYGAFGNTVHGPRKQPRAEAAAARR